MKKILLPLLLTAVLSGAGLYAAEHFADPNALDASGETAFTRAISTEVIYDVPPRTFAQMIANLVTRGGNINQPNEQGQTPLAKAMALPPKRGLPAQTSLAAKRKQKAIKVLQKYGAHE